MRLEGIYVAALSAHDIDALVQQSFLHNPARGEYVTIELRQEEDLDRTRIEVIFDPSDQRTLRGRTKEGKLVLIDLGEEAARMVKHPSVIIATVDGPDETPSSR